MKLSITGSPTPDELGIISAGLTAFNEADVGPANRMLLAVLVQDDFGSIIGGLSGYTAWGWLYVQWLWLSESLRGQGLAGRMLAMAEDEAKARGCHGSYIDTFSPVALKVYQRAGYVPFGALPEFPRGRTRTFLQKPL